MEEYIINQLTANLKDVLEEYTVENNDISADNLLRDVNKYLKEKDFHHE
jgi:hypothetical protein